LPAGYDKFLIVPNVGQDQWLPMGVLTDSIIDLSAGLATKVTGQFTLKVSSTALFTTDPKVNEALREAVADSIAGISKEHVRITNVTTISRRLREEQSARRLAAGSVKVTYEIVVPATYTGSSITAKSITATTLQTAINTRVAARGVVGATVTEAPVIGAVTSSSVGTPIATGGSQRASPLGFAFAFVGIAATIGITSMFH